MLKQNLVKPTSESKILGHCLCGMEVSELTAS